MAKKKTRRPVDDDSFEHCFEELQQIVARLEEGQLTLGDSLKCYEQGIKRLKDCHRALNEAENRIRLLTKVDEDGNLDLAEFDQEGTSVGKTTADRSGSRGSRKKKPVDEDGLF